MYHKMYLRDVPKNAIQVEPDKVKIPLANGKFEMRQLNETGKMIVHSEYWYARIKQPDGSWKEMVLAKGKQNAEHLKVKLQKDMEDIRCGRKVPVKEDQPLEQLILKWLGSKQGKGCTKGHLTMAQSDLRMVLNKLNVKEIKDFLHPTFEQRFQDLADLWLVTKRYAIKVPDIAEWTLDKVGALFGVTPEHALVLTKANAVPFTERDGRIIYQKKDIEVLVHSRSKPASRGTINRWTGMVKDFVNYLITQKVISLTHKPVMPPKLECKTIDRRKVRRAVSWTDTLKLCESVIAIGKVENTGNGCRIGVMSAFERSVLYRTAFCTLLRRRALEELRVSDCHLDSRTPFLSIRKETDKTGRARSIPIMNQQLLEDLKALMHGKTQDQLVFVVPKHTAVILRRDIKSANLDFRTTQGDWDFHAFRHSGATHMALNHVPLYQVCKIGGWANFEMFFDRYGHLTIEDLGKSVEGIF